MAASFMSIFHGQAASPSIHYRRD